MRRTVFFWEEQSRLVFHHLFFFVFLPSRGQESFKSTFRMQLHTEAHSVCRVKPRWLVTLAHRNLRTRKSSHKVNVYLELFLTTIFNTT